MLFFSIDVVVMWKLIGAPVNLLPAPFAMQSKGLGTTLCKHHWCA